MALALTSEIKLLAKHSAVYSLGTFMQRIVALLLLPIYTSYLTPNDYGIKELVGLSSDIIAILIATAISGAFYRFYFQYESEKERNEVVSTTLITIGFFGLLAISLLLFTTRTISKVVLDDPDLYYFFSISFSSIWFQSLNSIAYDYLKANKRSLAFIAFSFVKMVLAIGLNIYFICVLEIGVIGILISGLITGMVMTLVLTLPLFFKVGIHFSKVKISEMLRFGLPLIPAQIGAFIVHLSDRFFIKGYVSIADAGLYSLGYRFGTLPSTFISDPFNQIFQPRRFEVYKQEGSEYTFGRIFTYFLLLILFAGLLISVLTKEVLMIMAAKEFWSAYQIVPLIVMANMIFSFCYHLDMGIIIAKKTKYLAYINFSNGALVLLLNFLLIPRYGIWGAAWTTLFAFIYKAGLTYYFSSKFYKIHFEFMRILKLMFIAVVIYLSIQALVFDSVILAFISKVSLVLILYPFGLFLLRFFSDKEKSKLLYCLKNRTLAGLT